jgi:hypothetical protein
VRFKRQFAVHVPLNFGNAATINRFRSADGVRAVHLVVGVVVKQQEHLAPWDIFGCRSDHTYNSLANDVVETTQGHQIPRLILSALRDAMIELYNRLHFGAQWLEPLFESAADVHGDAVPLEKHSEKRFTVLIPKRQRDVNKPSLGSAGYRSVSDDSNRRERLSYSERQAPLH